MLTEEESKTKWCPMARVAEPARYGSADAMCPVAAVNRGSDALVMPNNSPTVLCIGSACMAWRWTRAKETQAFLAAVREYMTAEKCDFNKALQKVYARDGGKNEKTEGYCGAFGKAE